MSYFFEFEEKFSFPPGLFGGVHLTLQSSYLAFDFGPLLIGNDLVL